MSRSRPPPRRSAVRRRRRPRRSSPVVSRRPALPALAVAALLAVAGCSAVLPAGSTDDPVSTGEETATATPAATATPPPSPWGDREILVAVEAAPVYDEAAVRQTVREALDYWERHPTWYEPEFRLLNGTGDAGDEETSTTTGGASADPDVVVVVEPAVERCGGRTANRSFPFCVDYIPPETTVDGPTRVQIAGRYDETATDRVARAALGRLMGVEGYTPEGDRLRPSDLALADPWPDRSPVVVGVTVSADTVGDRQFDGLVRRAVDYWQRVDDRYGNYTAEMVVRPNATDPDVAVRVVDRVTGCGYDDGRRTIGCAPLLNRSRLAADTELVRVEAGYDDPTTLHVLKHEFGHLYGRVHGSAPEAVMRASPPDPGRYPRPNATDRANPYGGDAVSVYVADLSLSGRETERVREQVGRVLAYYDDGADGAVPASLSFERTTNRSAADVVVRFPEQLPRGGTGSDARTTGRNADDDPAPEFYGRTTVYVADVPTDRVGWHVGFWLASGMGLDRSAYPPPFDDPRSDPREDWWR